MRNFNQWIEISEDAQNDEWLSVLLSEAADRASAEEREFTDGWYEFAVYTFENLKVGL